MPDKREGVKMKYKNKIKIMITMLFILIITKSTDSLGGWGVETGDIDLDWNKLINVDSASCNTDVSHKCTNTQSCNIVVGPCVNKTETTTKTTTKTGTGKSPKETEPMFEFSGGEEEPSDNEQQSPSEEEEGSTGKISVEGGTGGKTKIGVGVNLKLPFGTLNVEGKGTIPK